MAGAAQPDLRVFLAEGRAWLALGATRWPCAVGRGGIRRRKREGDGATPVGRFALRGLYFRPDRGFVPETGLPLMPITPASGWCDAADDPSYNRPVPLPWRSSAERLWRDDDLYDLLVPLGYNDSPPRPGAGSAIFLHAARPGLTPTEGCIALRQPDLRQLLRRLDKGWHLTVEPADPC